MAKELPYYKHEPSEWLEGEIQICSDASIVCFTNLKDGYWLKLGVMSYAFALHKYCRKDESIIQELVDNGIIDVIDDNISISFLDKQLNEFQETSEKRRSAANKRWKNKETNASALQDISKSNAIREDKIREDKIKDINSRKQEFYNSLIPFLAIYEKEMIKEFYEYWTEHGEKDKKFRKEKEKSFNLELRLKTWFKRSKQWQKEKSSAKKEKVTAAQALREKYGIETNNK